MIKISHHAKKRLIERQIPDPNTLKLIPAGRLTKKKIKAACQVNGFRNERGTNYVYFIHKKTVFVCVVQEVNVFLLITAFILSP